MSMSDLPVVFQATVGITSTMFPSLSSLSRRLVVTAIVASLAGCAANNTYIQPDESSSAKLRVVQGNPDDYGLLLGELDPRTCQLRSQVGFLSQGAQKDAVRVGMLDGAPPVKDGILERRIPVGEPFAIVPKWFVTMLSLGSTLFVLNPVGGGMVNEEINAKRPSECRFPVFVPRQGEQYELRIDITPGNCDIRLQQLVLSPSSTVVREPVEPIGTVSYQLSGAGYPTGKCDIPNRAD